jgi:UTP--glucose-1-phosphate uridylyltransferase
VGDEPFAVILSDDIIKSDRPVIGQMSEIYEEHDGAVISVMKVLPDQISKYGAVIPSGEAAPASRLTRLSGMVEKPPVEEAPSNLAIIGRYILPPEIFGCLESVTPDAKSEIQLTDGIRALLGMKPVFAYEFDGKRYDAGDKLGFLEATVEFALESKEIGPSFREYLRSLNL